MVNFTSDYWGSDFIGRRDYHPTYFRSLCCRRIKNASSQRRNAICHRYCSPCHHHFNGLIFISNLWNEGGWEVFRPDYVALVFNARGNGIIMDSTRLVYSSRHFTSICLGIINDTSSRKCWFLDFGCGFLVYDGG